jgi:hypothetical protein
MRRSGAHEYRQAYNARAVVCADGAQLILAANLVATPVGAPSFAAAILTIHGTVGLPQRVLANTGFASGLAIAALQATGVEPLLEIGRTRAQRPYDFRPPPTAQHAATHHGTLAYRHESQVRDWRCQSILQEAHANRRTGVRHHQERDRLCGSAKAEGRHIAACSNDSCCTRKRQTLERRD